MKRAWIALAGEMVFGERGFEALKKHRGKLLVLSITVAAAVGAAGYFGSLPHAASTHRINPYTSVKLRVGMPQDKVEAIFGVPPGDYSSEPKKERVQGRGDGRLELRREDWTSDEGGAVVYFGPDGRWRTPREGPNGD